MRKGRMASHQLQRLSTKQARGIEPLYPLQMVRRAGAEDSIPTCVRFKNATVFARRATHARSRDFAESAHTPTHTRDAHSTTKTCPM